MQIIDTFNNLFEMRKFFFKNTDFTSFLHISHKANGNEYLLTYMCDIQIKESFKYVLTCHRTFL